MKVPASHLVFSDPTLVGMGGGREVWESVLIIDSSGVCLHFPLSFCQQGWVRAWLLSVVFDLDKKASVKKFSLLLIWNFPGHLTIYIYNNKPVEIILL